MDVRVFSDTLFSSLSAWVRSIALSLLIFFTGSTWVHADIGSCIRKIFNWPTAEALGSQVKNKLKAFEKTHQPQIHSPASTRDTERVMVDLPQPIHEVIIKSKNNFVKDFEKEREKPLGIIWLPFWKIQKGLEKRMRPRDALPFFFNEDPKNTSTLVGKLIVKSRQGEDLTEEIKIIEGLVEEYKKIKIRDLDQIQQGYAALTNLIQVKRGIEEINTTGRRYATLRVIKKHWTMRENKAPLPSLPQASLPPQGTNTTFDAEYLPFETALWTYDLENLRDKEVTILNEVRSYLGPVNVEIKNGIPEIHTDPETWHKQSKFLGGETKLLENEIDHAANYERLQIISDKLVKLKIETQDTLKDISEKPDRDQKEIKRREDQETKLDKILKKVEEAMTVENNPSHEALYQLAEKFYRVEYLAWVKGNRPKNGVLGEMFNPNGRIRPVLEELSKYFPPLKFFLDPDRSVWIKLSVFVAMGAGYKGYDYLMSDKRTVEQRCAEMKTEEEFIKCLGKEFKSRFGTDLIIRKNFGTDFPFTSANGSELTDDQKETVKIFMAVRLSRLESEKPIQQLAASWNEYQNLKERTAKEESSQKETINRLEKEIPRIKDNAEYSVKILSYLSVRYPDQIKQLTQLANQKKFSKDSQEIKKLDDEIKKAMNALLPDLQKMNAQRNDFLKSEQTKEQDSENLFSEINQSLKDLYQSPQPGKTK